MARRSSAARRARSAKHRAIGGASSINRVAVTSTNIASIAYVAQTSVLEIEFRNGSTYRYFLVPSSVYDAFRQASSMGVFFNQLIRPRYAFAKT